MTLFSSPSHLFQPFRPLALRIALLAFGLTGTGLAQIGGKTAADGPFLLEDAEDLDPVACGVLRQWIPDHVPGAQDAFRVLPLNSSDPDRAPGQSLEGSLCFEMRPQYGYISYGFGVPTPAIAAASTLNSPGNLTSFSRLTFLVALSGPMENRSLEVLLETYPGPEYPSIHWKYDTSPGRGFQRVTLDLWNPTSLRNQGTLAVGDLLARSRYLYFFFFGGPQTSARPVTVYLDDVQLLGPAAEVTEWSLY